jgi:hypothetical protein
LSKYIVHGRSYALDGQRDEPEHNQNDLFSGVDKVESIVSILNSQLIPDGVYLNMELIAPNKLSRNPTAIRPRKDHDDYGCLDRCFLEPLVFLKEKNITRQKHKTQNIDKAHEEQKRAE